MGFGDDWKAAQEAVKERAVPPGGKARVVHELAAQSVLPGRRDHHGLLPDEPDGARAKLMSMRFNRATVHRELIPGHHLQGFMNDRFNPHRDPVPPGR